MAKTLGENVRMPGTRDVDASEAEIDKLIGAVGGHARALVLITREVGRTGVRNATTQIDRIMRDLHDRFPNDRERSLIASVKLSLDRLPPETRQRIRPLGVFQGGGWLATIKIILLIETDNLLHKMARQLAECGLVEVREYDYLLFDPALTPTLLSELSIEEQEQARTLWAETMHEVGAFLYDQQFTDTHLAYSLAGWDLPNLLAALEYQTSASDAATIVEAATKIENLAQHLGRRNAIMHAVRIRFEAIKSIKDWSHAAHTSKIADIDRLLVEGKVGEALAIAEDLVKRCEAEGKNAYQNAAYDTAMAYRNWGRALNHNRASGTAIGILEESEDRFTQLAQEGDPHASRMALAARGDRANCLLALDRLEEAAELYEQLIQDHNQRRELRDLAVSNAQLGTVRMLQHRYADALQTYMEAKDTFESLREPKSVSGAWLHIGVIYKNLGDSPAAEIAYQNSLQIAGQQGDSSVQAHSLTELGSLYSGMKRHEDAIRFYREAATIYVKLKDIAGAEIVCINAAVSLIALQRYDEARSELAQAMEYETKSSYSSEKWITFNLLYELEKAVGNENPAHLARQKAIEAYLTYRRDSGASTDWGGYATSIVAQALAEGKSEATMAKVAEVLEAPHALDARKPLIRALKRIVSGERALTLANDPELFYMDAVELQILLETLNNISE